jgi:hypothetical protein
MEDYVRRFIRSSLVWLGIGVVLGLWMTFLPGQALAYRPAHMHANLLGFVSMMIFGVAYHVLPRFTGVPLRSHTMPRVHLVLANGGLALMVAGWMLRVGGSPLGVPALGTGAAASALGAFLFITNIWLSLGGRPLAAIQTPAVRKPPAAPVRVPLQ